MAKQAPAPNRTVRLACGESVPMLGQGTWRMGERARDRAAELRSLKLGLELGLTLIDTAEMYGDGDAEEIVGEAIAGQRDRVFLVSKVYPHNASAAGVVGACERSLKRLGTDRLDLYLLHWRGTIPLAETVAGFTRLVEAGKIRHWGVSNFGVADMEELWSLDGGPACQTNQVVYSLARRGIETGVLAWCRRHQVPVMAYSPLDQGHLPSRKTLARIAARHQATAMQVALAWLMDQEDLIVIPKATNEAHLRENVAALSLRLDAEDRAEIDRDFPPPRGAVPLEIL